MLPALHLLLMLLLSGHRAVRSDDSKVENDETASSPVTNVFHPGLCTRFRQRRDTESNTVLVLHAQVEPLARISNALYLANFLANSSNSQDDVLNELINFADASVIKSLESLDMAQVFETLKELQTLPLFLTGDRTNVVAGLEALLEVKARHSKLGDLVEEQVVLGFTQKLKRFPSFDVTILDTYDGTKLIGDLEYLKSPSLDVNDATFAFPKISAGVENLDKITNSVASLDLADFDDIIAGSDLLQTVMQSAHFFNFFQSQKTSLQVLSTSLPSVSDDVKKIQDFAKLYASNESVVRKVGEFNDFIIKLKSSTSPTVRMHTAALPRGIHDLNLLTSDLRSPWIQKVFGPKKMELLKSALNPLEKIITKISQFETELHTVAARGSVLLNVNAIAQMTEDILDLKLHPGNLDTSKSAVEYALGKLQDVTSVNTKQLESGLSKLKTLGHLLTQLKEAVSTLANDSNFTSLGDLTVLKTALTMPAQFDAKTLQDRMKSLKDDGKLNETIQKIRNIDPAMDRFKTILQAVAGILDDLQNFESTVQAVNKHSHASHQSLVSFLQLLPPSDNFEPIHGGFQFAANLRKWSLDSSFFKDTKGILSDVYSSKNLLNNVRKLMTLPEEIKERPEMQKIISYKHGQEVSKVLGIGSLLVGELGNALAKKTDLETVVKHSDVIGQQIKNVKDQKIKSDIEKGWKDSAKISTSLEALIAFVDQLSKGIPSTGAASVKEIGEFLEKAKKVEDPKISVKNLQASVGLLNVAVSNSEVTETNVALFHITNLDLNFAARTSAITDVSASIGALNKFLDDLFTISKPSPPSSDDNTTSSDSSDTSTPAPSFCDVSYYYWWWFAISCGFSVGSIVTVLIIRARFPRYLDRKKDKDVEKMEGSTQTQPATSQTRSSAATPDPTGDKETPSPPTVKINNRLKAQLLETQTNLSRLRAHVKKSTAQHKSDTRASKFANKGPIFIPMEPDVPPAATNLPDNIILDNVTYDPSGNEMFEIGSDVDDVEMDTSLTLDAASSAADASSKAPSKKKSKSKGSKKSGKPKGSGKRK